MKHLGGTFPIAPPLLPGSFCCSVPVFNRGADSLCSTCTLHVSADTLSLEH